MPGVSVPAAPPLVRLDRVELVRVGHWSEGTGAWHASRGDLAAAVAALDCPAVRQPIIKLDGAAVVWAGNPTGAPAVGRVERLTVTDGGDALVGDLVDMPAWLGQVAGDAPRAVDGTYDFRCQIGHTHPFVIHSVSLLGVDPPGVGVLRSLQDVARLYGVTAGDGASEVVAHLAGRHDQSTHGRRYPGRLFDEFGDVARAVLALASGDTVEVDHTEQGAVIGFGADGVRYATEPLTADDTVGLRNALRHGIGDGDSVLFGADGELSRDGDDYLLTVGDAFTTLADVDRARLADLVEHAVTPRALIGTIDGDVLVKGTPDGGVTLRWDSGADTSQVDLSPGDAAGLVDVLDRLTQVDTFGAADDPVDSAVVGPVDVDLFGSGLVVVSWDGDDQRVEVPLDAADVAEVREALAELADEDDDGDRVAAAADHTGAMVALLPSDADIDRLTVDGGEPASDLHLTVMYLGEAAGWPPAARRRLEDEVRALAEAVPPGHVDGFAIAAFNMRDPDKDTAVVVEVSGDGLEDLHGLVEAAVDEVAEQAGVTVPAQYTPWRPHITLAYTNDLSRVVAWADRTGPVYVDRIRVAWAGTVVDIPLTGEGSDVDVDALTDGDMPDPEQVEAARTSRVTRSDAPLRRYWLRGKGAAKIRWNTPGDWRRCVRQLRRYVRDPKGLCAVYHKEATGMWTGEKRHLRMGAVAARRGFDPNQPRDRYGRWTDMHLATAAEIAEFRAKVGKSIPPGWTDVHIADDLDTASVLARGVDSKGRVHGIYSAEYTRNQAAVKFARVQRLNDHLDKLDYALERDAATDDAAAALLLIRRLGLRPGSNRDTRARVQAYGATTLQARHVKITKGGVARLRFIGKEGVPNDHTISDPVVVDALARRLATRRGRDPLFDTSDRQVRDYMRTTGGVPGEFLVKDLRTVRANAVALQEVNAYPEPPATKTEFVKRRREVAKKVAAALGNTPTVALASYINPTVFTAWIKDPAWVNAAAAVLSRDEERRLLSEWFETVTFDHLPAGIPPVAPEPDDPDDETGPGLVAAAAVSDTPWSRFSDADYTPEQLRRAALIVLGDTKADMKLPVREPDGTLNRHAIRAAAARINQVDAPPSAVRAAARELARLYRDVLGEEPPPNVRQIAASHPAAGRGSESREDNVSMDEVRRRLGLAEETADEDVLAALDELIAAVNEGGDEDETEEVAAAAAENEELRREVALLQSQVEDLSTQVAAAAAAEAAAMRKQVLDEAVAAGKIAPADRAQWERDYDEAPAVVRRVLASIAPGTRVPTKVAGTVGEPVDTLDDDSDLEPEPAWLDGPN